MEYNQAMSDAKFEEELRGKILRELRTEIGNHPGAEPQEL